MFPTSPFRATHDCLTGKKFNELEHLVLSNSVELVSYLRLHLTQWLGCLDC